MRNSMPAKLVIFLMLILLLPIIIVLGNFRLIIYNTEFYTSEFEKLEVYKAYPEADVLAQHIINYYRKGTELPEDMLNEKERRHLKDVKFLVNSAIYALYAAIIIYVLLLFALSKLTKSFPIFLAYIKKSLLAGSLLLMLLLFLSAIISVNFHTSFAAFHSIFFKESTHLFPQESVLIKTFPEQFFADIVQGIILNSLIIALALSSFFFITIKKK